MATQVKELVKRSDIRTMKKDLKRLREADAATESEKIIKFDLAPKKPAQPKPVSPPPQKPVAPPVVKKPAPEHLSAQALFAKEHANETEKQRMFALESQKTELSKQLATKEQEKTPIVLEKNRLAQKQQEWQEKKNRMDVKKAEEKERWPIERELSTINAQIKTIDEQYAAAMAQEGQIRQKIKDTNTALEQVYQSVKSRQEALKNPVPVPPPTANPKPINPPAQNRPYLKEASEAIKETIAKVGVVESERRRTFMEDVERWVNSTK